MNANNELFNDPLPGDILDRLDGDVPREKWTGTLANYVDAVESKYKRGGMEAPTALRLAIEAVAAICELYGGQTHYLPKGDNLRRALRDKQIWHDFDGRNIDKLIQRYRLSNVQIYQIIKEQKALHQNRIQPDLPLD